MRVCTVSRKPLSGTVASNTLGWGCGGIAVDRCRIGTETRFNPPAKCKPGGTSYNMSVVGMPEDAEGQWAEGRWPPNVLLRSDAAAMLESLLESTTNTRHMSYQRGGGPFIDGIDDASEQAWFTQETGTPVRFFKQYREDKMSNKISQELLEYLYTMITPDGGETLILLDLNQVEFGPHEDSRYHGIIAMGEPTPEQSAEMLRILRPGGHCMLIAPDENRLGDIGACTLEDSGFDIRDAILLVAKDDPEDEDEVVPFHYVPKASRAEREAGCHFLPARTGAETVEREEDSAGLDSPRAGAGRTADKVHNFHPTVKPIEVMRKLLEDVPTDEGPIVDPFMGSGSTGLACLKTGHDFIGIERDKDYIPIADARIRHWENHRNAGTPPVEIESESPVQVDLDNYQMREEDEFSLLGAFVDDED